MKVENYPKFAAWVIWQAGKATLAFIATNCLVSIAQSLAVLATPIGV